MRHIELFENHSIIPSVILDLIKTYKHEHHTDVCHINLGSCDIFAEDVEHILKTEYNIDVEILSDGFFYDCFNDTLEEDLWDVENYSSKPPEKFKEIGLPSHYWIYYKGKHYDSDSPYGVNDMFDLKTIKNFYGKNRS